MDWEAQNAQQRFQQTGVITVVVQDQGSIHTSMGCERALKRVGKTGALYFPTAQVLLTDESH